MGLFDEVRLGTKTARNRVVFATAVHHNFFGRKWHAVQTTGNRLRLVVGDDSQGEREGAHRKSLPESGCSTNACRCKCCVRTGCVGWG